MSYDVTIDGHGFMLQDGTYTRTQDGIREARLGRVRLFDFFGGGQRAAQFERDRFWHGDGAWPAFDSQGVVPGPKRQDVVEGLGGGAAFNPQLRTWSTIWNGQCFLAQADRVYRVQVGTGGSYAGLQLMQTTTEPITDAVATRGRWWFAHGTEAVVSAYNLEEDSYQVEALGVSTTRQTNRIGTHLGRIAFQGVDIWQEDQVSLHEIETAGHDLRYVESPVRQFVEHRGACWFITERGLFRFTMGGVEHAAHTADYSSEATVPQIGYPDDLTWAVSHMGDLWFWMGKEVHRYNAGDRTFEPMGLWGVETYGAASVGRYLVVNVEREDTRQLWAWDGRGWWLLDEGLDFGWPVPIYGVAGNADLFAGRGTTNNHTALWQFFDRDGEPAFRPEMTLTSSMLDGGERDLDKVWRRVGAVFGWPDDRDGADVVGIRLAYSTDAGETWTEIAIGDAAPADRTVTIAADIPVVEQSRFIQLRVTVEDVDDWAPVLLGMWAEHETLDMPVRRRRWRFTVRASDTAVNRDGGSAGTAEVISERLWAAWETNIVSYTDLDGETYTVRVVSISETIGNQRRGAMATRDLEVALVEV